MWAKQQISLDDGPSFIRDARDYALSHGLVIRSTKLTNDNCVVHIPFTLFPSAFPRRLYEECLDLQPIINVLMCKLANDTDFLSSVLKPIAEVDSFTKNLLDINSTIVREGQAQPLLSCISRSDYMLNREQCGTLGVRQVEVNTIASSMSAHSYNVEALHEYIYTKYSIKLPDRTSIPENSSLDTVASGIIGAFDAYGQASAYVLLLGEERSLNFSDHHHIELRVHQKRPDIRFLRRKFSDLTEIVNLGPNKELRLGSKEIALVYFRHGYDPSDYNFDRAWALRLILERSRAIKCPSIAFHLAGAKKFQQVLNSARQLEKYLDTSSSERLANTFCKIWSLDSEEFGSSEQYKLIKENSSGLVLKPQREGGGHNIFGDQIRPFVESISNPNIRSQYILMEYINSPREKNWLLLQDEVDDNARLTRPDCMISELGIYGTTLANGPQVILNETGGFLIRSKRFGVNEGGVSVGYAGIGNLLLVDDCEFSDFIV